MTPFSNDGTIRQQGIQARNIARHAIAKAIAEEAQRTGVLVSNTIGRITMNQLAPKSVEDLWNDIVQAYEKSLDDIQAWLGDDHNPVCGAQVSLCRFLDFRRGFGPPLFVFGVDAVGIVIQGGIIGE